MKTTIYENKKLVATVIHDNDSYIAITGPKRNEFKKIFGINYNIYTGGVKKNKVQWSGFKIIEPGTKDYMVTVFYDKVVTLGYTIDTKLNVID